MRRDLVVVGGGVAGLAAALTAATHGLDVELIEATPALGGAALLSNGSLWTFDDVETYLEHCPGADPHLADRVTRQFGTMPAWLRERGVTVTVRGPSLYGVDHSQQVVPQQLVSTLDVALRRRATVTLDEPLAALAPAPGGMTVQTASGRRIDAAAVVLATGGIHADAAMLRSAGLDHYVGLPLRNRQVVGAGVRIGLDLGGHLAGTPDGIYGHLVPTGLPPTLVTESLAAQYQSWSGVVLGGDGAALAPPRTDDHHLNRHLARQPGRRGVLVYDAAARPPRIRTAVGGTNWAIDRFEFARTHASRTARADSVAELEAALVGWGYPAPAPQARAAMASVLLQPPFFAVEVEPSLTHCGTALRVDASLRAVGLTGVYVAGQDIGGGFGDGYGGGLAFALATGIGAGAVAAKDIRTRRHETTTGQVG